MRTTPDRASRRRSRDAWPRRSGAGRAIHVVIAVSAGIAASSLVLACQPRVTPKPEGGPHVAPAPAATKSADEPHTAEARAALVGRPAPALTLEGIDGARVALA